MNDHNHCALLIDLIKQVQETWTNTEMLKAEADAEAVTLDTVVPAPVPIPIISALSLLHDNLSFEMPMRDISSISPNRANN